MLSRAGPYQAPYKEDRWMLEAIIISFSMVVALAAIVAEHKISARREAVSRGGSIDR